MEQAAPGLRSRFLFAAIKDAQGNIRAIDTKVSILLAALAIPRREIASTFQSWHARGFAFTLTNVMTVLAIAAYVVAVIVAVRTLMGIGDATKHVRGARLKNSFYSGDLFRFSWLDALVNHPRAQSSKTVAEYVTALPQTREAIWEELAMEAMTLAYIRDVKIHRQRLAFGATVVAGALALLALLL